MSTKNTICPQCGAELIRVFSQQEGVRLWKCTSCDYRTLREGESWRVKDLFFAILYSIKKTNGKLDEIADCLRLLTDREQKQGKDKELQKDTQAASDKSHDIEIEHLLQRLRKVCLQGQRGDINLRGKEG